jgi:hypothetical protein
MFARFSSLKVGPAGSFVEKMKNLQVPQMQEIFYYWILSYDSML